jgi:hypothetical protein
MTKSCAKQEFSRYQRKRCFERDKNTRKRS